jgi:hypothetical protein
MRVPTATSEDKCLTLASLPLAIFVVSIPFNLGTISNHHLFVIDVDMGSLIGEDFPRVVRLPGRKLQDVPAKPTSNHIVGISSNTASSKYTKSFYSAIIPFRMKRSRDRLTSLTCRSPSLWRVPSLTVEKFSVARLHTLLQ